MHGWVAFMRTDVICPLCQRFKMCLARLDLVCYLRCLGEHLRGLDQLEDREALVEPRLELRLHRARLHAVEACHLLGDVLRRLGLHLGDVALCKPCSRSELGR